MIGTIREKIVGYDIDLAAHRKPGVSIGCSRHVIRENTRPESGRRRIVVIERGAENIKDVRQAGKVIDPQLSRRKPLQIVFALPKQRIIEGRIVR